jgi:hypothetical protein
MAPRFNVVARLIGELTAGLLDTAADHARIVAAREEVLHAITMGKSLINVEDGRQAAYWQQGDERLSTAEAFHARFSLRRDPLVRASLHAIWEATLRSIQSSDRSGTTLNFDGYKLLFTRVYRVVLDGDDLSDIDASIDEDWETDRKGHNSLTREQLCDSLFELCDHWTTSIDRTEYAQWLDNLLARCSTLMPVVGTDGIERQLPFLWKEEDMQGACFDSAGAGEAGEQARWAGSRHSGGSSGGRVVRTRRSGILTLIFASRLIQQCTRRLQGIARGVGTDGGGTDGAKGRARERAKGRGSSEACAPGIGSGTRASTSATKRREHVGYVGGGEHSEQGVDVDDDDATLLAVGHGKPVGRSGAVVSTCMREDDATLLAEIDAARGRVAELQRRRAAGELTAEEVAQLQALERHLALFDADNDLVAVAAELRSARARMAELERRRAAGELTPEELAELTALEGRVAVLEAPADVSSGGRAGRLQRWALRGGDEFVKPEHTTIQPALNSALNDPATRIAALQSRLTSEGLTPAELAELQALLQAQHPRLVDSHEGVGGGAGGPRHGRRGGLRSGVESGAPSSTNYVERGPPSSTNYVESGAPDKDEVTDERRRHEKHENGRPRAEPRAAGKATLRDAELLPVEQLETSMTECSGAEITSSGHAEGTRGKLQPWALRQPEVGKLIAEEPLWKRRAHSLGVLAERSGRSARSGTSGAADTWPPRRMLTRVVRRTPKPRPPPAATSRLTSSRSATSLPPLSASHSGDALGKTSTLKHAAQNKSSEILASVGLRSSKMVPGSHACADGDFILRPLSREQASLALRRAFRGEPCPFNLSAFRQVPSTDGLPSELRESKRGHLPSELSPASLKSMVESLQQNSLSTRVPLADPLSTSPSTSPSLQILRDWRATEGRSVLWYGQSLTATELVPARAALAPLPKASCSSLPPLTAGMLSSVAHCGLKSVESAPGKLKSTRPQQIPAADMQMTQRRLVTGTREQTSRRLHTPITLMWWGISESVLPTTSTIQ